MINLLGGEDMKTHQKEDIKRMSRDKKEKLCCYHNIDPLSKIKRYSDTLIDDLVLLLIEAVNPQKPRGKQAAGSKYHEY